jgi:hypothetical protein
VDVSTGRFWTVHFQLITAEVHGVKTSGCGIKDSETLFLEGREAGYACMYMCV